MYSTLTFAELIGHATSLITALVPLVGSLAFLAFLIGIARFIFSAGDTKSHEDGKFLMIWGLVALFVMFSIWGIIRLLASTFGFSLN